MDKNNRDISEILAKLPRDNRFQSFSLEEFATLRRILKEIEKNSDIVTRKSPEGETQVTIEIPNNVLEVLIGELVTFSRVNPDKQVTLKEKLDRTLKMFI